jgi:hypothetical protein
MRFSKKKSGVEIDTHSSAAKRTDVNHLHNPTHGQFQRLFIILRLRYIDSKHISICVNIGNSHLVLKGKTKPHVKLVKFHGHGIFGKKWEKVHVEPQDTRHLP